MIFWWSRFLQGSGVLIGLGWVCVSRVKSLLQQSLSSTLGNTDANNPMGFFSVSSYVLPCFGCLSVCFQYTEDVRVSIHSCLNWMYGLLFTVCYHEREVNSPSLWVFQTFQTQGIGFEVWSWGALCLKRPGDCRTQVGLSNHLSDGTSITWWTLLCWHSVAYVLWFCPFEGYPVRTTARDALSYDVKGKWKHLFLLDKEIRGPTEKPCARSVMVSSEWRVNVLTLQRWERPRTNTALNTASLHAAPTRVGLHLEGRRIEI